jgi:hypothetical protein
VFHLRFVHVLTLDVFILLKRKKEQYVVTEQNNVRERNEKIATFISLTIETKNLKQNKTKTSSICISMVFDHSVTSRKVI